LARSCFDVYSPDLNVLQHHWRGGRPQPPMRPQWLSRLPEAALEKLRQGTPPSRTAHPSPAAGTVRRQDRHRRHAFLQPGETLFRIRRYLPCLGDRADVKTSGPGLLRWRCLPRSQVNAWPGSHSTAGDLTSIFHDWQCSAHRALAHRVANLDGRLRADMRDGEIAAPLDGSHSAFRGGGIQSGAAGVAGPSAAQGPLLAAAGQAGSAVPVWVT